MTRRCGHVRRRAGIVVSGRHGRTTLPVPGEAPTVTHAAGEPSLAARLGLRLLGQAEHPLADDVALDLRRAAPDRLGPAEEERRQHRAHRVAGPCPGRAARPATSPTRGRRRRAWPRRRRCRGPAPSPPGASRTRTSCWWRRARRSTGPCGPCSVAVSVRRPLIADDLDLRSSSAASRWRMTGRRSRRWRVASSTICVPLLLEAAVAGGGRLAPLEAERGVGDRPAVVEAADDVVLRAAGVGEEHLVELGGAVGLRDGPHLDAGLLHRHEQVRDARVLRRVGVGAGEQEAVVGELGLGGPHLLAVDHPLVAVEHGRGLERREVGAGVGLAEALAPADRARAGSAAGTPASAPRCPTAGSWARRACRRRSRPAAAPWPGRTPRRAPRPA